MALQPTLTAGTWRASLDTPDGDPTSAPAGVFRSTNPASGATLADSYPISPWREVETALLAAQGAVEALWTTPPDAIAAFLDAYAAAIETRADALVDMAHLETALPADPRLRSVELPRTTGQLRQAAAACRERTWRRATIDSKLNIRSKYAPLGGPVVIFGPNNFPFAFNAISGGDFAAAVAAGNPVIAKAHPSHPGTTLLLAEAAFEALQAARMPPATVQMLYHLAPEDGLRLVAHPLIGATAFTGSRTAGLRLKEAADRAGRPIYLEMSSLNPVFILPGALAERSEAVAGELFGSCTLGVGQFCTKPGLAVLVDDANGAGFVEQTKHLFAAAPAGVLLSEQGPKTLAAALGVLQGHGAKIVARGSEPMGAAGFRFAPVLLVVSGDAFLAQPDALQTEAFGPAALLVLARDATQMVEIAARLDGNLTGSIYSHSLGQDDGLYAQLEPVLRRKVGRLLNDKMPTGVAVTAAMNHGGPYPATGHPGFTAVGIPAAMLRFAALHSYDTIRHDRLPPELQNRNPTGRMWRLIDGEWTQGDVG